MPWAWESACDTLLAFPAGITGKLPVNHQLVGIVPTRIGYAVGKSDLWRFAMPRKANENRLRQIAGVLREQPGRRAGEYARLLGLRREEFNRILVQLNDRRILLSEDDRGRLWPFGRDSM
jgi:hypothetical protein